ncbi:MFS transporter [Streptomyces sp. NPDC001492]
MAVRLPAGPGRPPRPRDRALSRNGARITAIAVPLIASRTLHASLLEMGALVAMEYVPYLVLSLLAGVWLDRRPKRPLLILSDVVRAGLLVSIPVSRLLDLLSVPVLLVMALLIGFCTVAVGTQNRTPRRLRLIGPRPHLLAAAEEAPISTDHDRGTYFWLQLTPLTQRAGLPRLREDVHQVPRPIDSQDKIARERGEVVHDRDFDLGTRGRGAVSYEQRHPLGVTHQVDDRVIISEGQGQHREVPARRPNLDVPLATGTQVTEVI